MKAAVMTETREVKVMDVPEPVMDPTDIKVKISYCGVCGSELHMFDPAFAVGSGKPQQKPSVPRPGPRILGHEASGTIVEIGNDCHQGYKIGQRVAMNFRSPCGACYYCRNGKEHFCDYVTPHSGGYAEYGVYRENDIYALPDNVSLEEGAMLEPVSVAVHTIDLANIKPGNSVAILGGGPIGLLCLALAVKAGAARTLLSEPIESKRQLAKQIGADVTVDPTREDVMEASKSLTEGRGFDTVIEAVGKLPLAEQAIEMADYGGTVVWAAMYPAGVKAGVAPSYLYNHELTLRSVFISPYSFPRALNLIPKLDLKPWISIMPLDNIREAFQTLLQGKAVKMLIKP
ncbi:MAG: alcohol dehydrogenase catalytic domain-containing protein [Dehalococcoidales bacterium]|nr:alcohol dehydrogenase catalytic domain-containing protein [Dehalococcoidales bacterium]